MATVTIVKPNITQEEEKKVFENIAYAMGKIVEKEYGANVKFTLERVKR